MKISKLESALILTEALVELGPHAHELDIYEAVYEFLEYAEEQEYDAEPLDEEDEYELTPAGQEFLDAREAADAEDRYVDEMDAEFSPFSPSVGTFEGTQEIEHIYGRTAKRAPVAERVHVPFKGVQKTIAEAFTPCGAD